MSIKRELITMSAGSEWNPTVLGAVLVSWSSKSIRVKLVRVSPDALKSLVDSRADHDNFSLWNCVSLIGSWRLNISHQQDQRRIHSQRLFDAEIQELHLAHCVKVENTIVSGQGKLLLIQNTRPEKIENST
jgi:hypothetical protein